MNRRLLIWLVGVVIFVVGGAWLYQGLGYYQEPSNLAIDPYQVYYGGAVVVAGIAVMLFSRRVAT